MEFQRFSGLIEKLKYIFLALVVYRIGSFIPVPGANPLEVARLLASDNNLFGLFNTLSGGALSRLSLFTMGIMPYITTSILVQIMSTFYPPFEQLKKEGERGRAKIAYYTRIGAILFAALQSVGMIRFLASSGILNVPSYYDFFLVSLTFVTGTSVLMWIGDQLSEKGLGAGQGVSLILFVGIVTGLPSVTGQALENLRYGLISPLTFIISLAVLFAVLYGIVFVERAQRKIPVYYVRKQNGYSAHAGGVAQQRSDLPLKINMAGVMPTIFASNAVLAPMTIAQFFQVSQSHWLIQFFQENLSSGKLLFMILFSVAIIFFSFVYVAVFYNTNEIAENLKKSGGVIQGVRPGASTAHYIDLIMTRLTALGAVYITIVSLLPELLSYFGTIPFSFGGTTLLIVVVVVMDFFTQVQAQLFSAQYESVLKRYQPKKNALLT